MANFRILLRDTQTFQEAWHEYSVQQEYADNQDFWWFDGNGACDCNRLAFLHEALGIYDEDAVARAEESGNDLYPCGHNRVALIEAWQDGKQLTDWKDESR